MIIILAEVYSLMPGLMSLTLILCYSCVTKVKLQLVQVVFSQYILVQSGLKFLRLLHTLKDCVQIDEYLQ